MRAAFTFFFFFTRLIHPFGSQSYIESGREKERYSCFTQCVRTKPGTRCFSQVSSIGCKLPKHWAHFGCFSQAIRELDPKGSTKIPGCLYRKQQLHPLCHNVSPRCCLLPRTVTMSPNGPCPVPLSSYFKAGNMTGPGSPMSTGSCYLPFTDQSSAVWTILMANKVLPKSTD